MQDITNPTSRCPFHRFAQADNVQGQKLYAMASDVESIKNRCGEIFTTYDKTDMASRFIGDVTLHPFLHNQGRHFKDGIKATPFEKQTPVMRLIGEMHAEFRKVAERIGDLLDRESLTEDTLERIRRYHKTVGDYVKAVAATREESPHKLPAYQLMPASERTEHVSRYNDALAALKCSELSAAATIPVKTRRGTLRVNNENIDGTPLGLLLFLLRQDAAAQTDENKIILHQHQATVGTQSSITQKWNAIASPQIRQEIECISKEAFLKIGRIVKEQACTLQMINLIAALYQSEDYGARNLCNVEGLRPFPSALASSAEAASLLEFMRCVFKAPALDSVINALNPPSPTALSKRSANKVMSAFQKAHPEPAVQTACMLLKPFLKERQLHPRVAAVSDLAVGGRGP